MHRGFLAVLFDGGLNDAKGGLQHLFIRLTEARTQLKDFDQLSAANPKLKHGISAAHWCYSA